MSLPISPATRLQAVGFRVPAALGRALQAAVVSLVLTIPIVGLQTAPGLNGLQFQPNFTAVAWIAALVFSFTLAFSVLARPIRRAAAERRSLMSPAFVLTPIRLRLVAAGALGLAILLPFLSSNYLIDLATAVLIYVMLGWGLNIVVGLAGLLDLGYVAFYGVGAYTVALLSKDFGLGFWACLPLAGLCAALFGIALGFPVLRLRGDYLAIVTLGFGEIIRIILTNWQSLTNGPNGIGSIPRPSFFGLSFSAISTPVRPSFAHFFGIPYAPQQRAIFLYFVILALALLTNLFTLRMRRLPIGRAWEALREDEIACRALGINPILVKLSAFAIGAMFAGLAGAFFAARQGFISPESFTFNESAIILAIVVLGGMGSQFGVVIAAILLVTLPELARGLAEYRMLLFGAAMVLIMIVRPRGIVSRRAPSITLPSSSASITATAS